MHRTLLLLITIIACAPLMGMDLTNQIIIVEAQQSSDTQLPPPPMYQPPLSPQEQLLSLSTSTTNNSSVYLPQLFGNQFTNQSSSSSVHWLHIVALISQAQRQNALNQNNHSSGSISQSSSYDHLDDDEDSNDSHFNACLLPFCIPVDFVCMPAVSWRRMRNPSTAGRNQYCYFTRNLISDCSGIRAIHITHTNPEDVDRILNCSTPAWSDTSADTPHNY